MKHALFFYEHLQHIRYVEYETYYVQQILELAQGILGNFLEWLP